MATSTIIRPAWTAWPDPRRQVVAVEGKPRQGATTEGKRKTGSRNNKGHVTSRGIAGGASRSINFHRLQASQVGRSEAVERLEYDPNRTGVYRAHQI